MPVRSALLLALALAGCAGPASPAAGPVATLGPATAADTKELRMEVAGLI